MAKPGACQFPSPCTQRMENADEGLVNLEAVFSFQDKEIDSEVDSETALDGGGWVEGGMEKAGRAQAPHS